MVATISAITSGSSRVAYFEKEGYYAKDDPEHRQASRWYGAGAVALGLSSFNPSGEYRARTVSPAAFEAVLDGRLPGTQITLGRIRNGVREHRPGVDITFSAPKSVSIERIFHPKLIDKCHDTAVARTLDFIEQELLQTRIYDPATKRRDRVLSPSLVAATFRHEASRNLDTNLHTHCIIANMTHGDDGRWRSVETTALSRNIRLIGAFYRNELAGRLEDNGFVLNRMRIGRMQGFEIAGYERGEIEAFSTRRMDILAYMKDRGWSYNKRNAQQAALDTRPAKSEPDRAVMYARWAERVAEMGLTSQRLPSRRVAPETVRQADGDRQTGLLGHVSRSVAHLEERVSVFPARDLITDVLERKAGIYQVDEIRAAVDRLAGDGHLVSASLTHAPDAFVTDRALRAERAIIRAMRDGRDAVKPLCPFRAVMGPPNNGKPDIALTDGQREAIESILTTGDRIIGIQGRAGTGKTTMLAQLPDALSKKPILALAPSRSATHMLATETGITAKTLSWFLTRYQGVRDGGIEPDRLTELRDGLKGGLLIIDEASMVGTDQMHRLFDITKGLEIDHLVLIGDTRQLRAVQAGQPFRQLQQAGMQTVMMDEILRQRNPDLKLAVEHILEGQPAMALEGLDKGRGGKLIETPDLAEKAAELWLALPEEMRKQTALLAPTHAMRADIHENIRNGLRDEGGLSGLEISLTRHINTHMTRAQLGDAANYHPGDVVRFHQDVLNHRVQAGDIFRVTGHETDPSSGRRRVRLQDDAGNRRHINPDSSIRYRLSVYETAEMELQAGDRIRWTANDRERELFNGDGARVTRIGRGRVVLLCDDGREFRMKMDDPQLCHCEHGYSSTVHAAQGITRDHVIAVLESGHGQLSDQQSFYVELSRARDHAVVLTDNIEQLTETLTANTGERLTALEAIGEVADERPGRNAPDPALGRNIAEPPEPADRKKSVDVPVAEARVRDVSSISLAEHEADWQGAGDALIRDYAPSGPGGEAHGPDVGLTVINTPAGQAEAGDREATDREGREDERQDGNVEPTGEQAGDDLDHQSGERDEDRSDRDIEDRDLDTDYEMEM